MASASVNVTTRMDSEVKAPADELFLEKVRLFLIEGFALLRTISINMATAVNMVVRQGLREA